MGSPRTWLSLGGAVVLVVAVGVLLWRGRVFRARDDAPYRVGRARAGSTGSELGKTNAYEEDWDSYMARVNGAIASLFVDLGRRATAPDAARPVLLWAHVKMRNPRPDGLSSAGEAPELLRLGHEMEAAVNAASGSVLAGRITSAGYREFYFYAPRADGFEAAVTGTLGAFPGYEATMGSKSDLSWSQYLDVLYPSPPDLRRIKNQGVYEALRKHGDVSSVRRVVSHWAYFTTMEARDAFAARATAKGYSEPDGGRSEADGRFGIRLEREGTTDAEPLDAATIELDDLARGLGGEYDGWETSVERGR